MTNVPKFVEEARKKSDSPIYKGGEGADDSWSREVAESQSQEKQKTAVKKSGDSWEQASSEEDERQRVRQEQLGQNLKSLEIFFDHFNLSSDKSDKVLIQPEIKQSGVEDRTAFMENLIAILQDPQSVEDMSEKLALDSTFELKIKGIESNLVSRTDPENAQTRELLRGLEDLATKTKEARSMRELIKGRTKKK